MITGSARFDLETQHVDVAKEPVVSLPLLGGVEKVCWLILDLQHESVFVR